jgi:hypothetical protein
MQAYMHINMDAYIHACIVYRCTIHTYAHTCIKIAKSERSRARARAKEGRREEEGEPGREMKGGKDRETNRQRVSWRE